LVVFSLPFFLRNNYHLMVLNISALNVLVVVGLLARILPASADVGLERALDEQVLQRQPESRLRSDGGGREQRGSIRREQAQGKLVAMTGDGGVAMGLVGTDVAKEAMGLVGTDVAKEAADLVLTNDDFSAIATALGEGRAVYDNLRKFTTYIFASNVPEILPFVLSALLNIPLALHIHSVILACQC
jgi:high-affinity K+ transport system ATPase subunit B